MSKIAAAICVGFGATIGTWLGFQIFDDATIEDSKDGWIGGTWPDWQELPEDWTDTPTDDDDFIKSLRGGSSPKDQEQVKNLKRSKDFVNIADRVIELSPMQENYWRTKLLSSPGTGYKWIYNQNSCPGVKVDISTVQTMGQGRTPDSRSSRNYALFSLMPVTGEGECELEFAYARAFDFDWDSKTDRAMDTLELNVVWEGQAPIRSNEALANLRNAYDLDDHFDENVLNLEPYTASFLKAGSNPSTGYSWQVDYSACPGISIEMENIKTSDTEMKGAPGKTLFTVTAQTDGGRCTARLAYAKSWEFNWDKRIKMALDMVEVELSWRSESQPRTATQNEVYLLDDFAYDLDLHDANSLLQVGENESTYWKAMSNPSTGNRWIFDQDSCAQLTIDIETVTLPQDLGENERPLLGAPTMALFKVSRPETESGSCTVRLANARPWEFNWDSDQDLSVEIKELDVYWG